LSRPKPTRVAVPIEEEEEEMVENTALQHASLKNT